MDQIWEGVLGDGLEGNFWEESKLECLHGYSGHDFHWQFVPARDYSNSERMLAATGFTPLLVNFECMTSKPNAGGSNKDYVA